MTVGILENCKESFKIKVSPPGWTFLPEEELAMVSF
jgi:hypothetical protein